MTKDNDYGIKAVFKGASYAIQRALGNAPYDRTFIGLVIDTDLETNTYTVRIDEQEYNNVMSTIRTYPNRTVLVMCPQNQLSQMFIYGEIDTTNYLDE